MADTYDLILRGGHVIDPRHHVDRVADVAVAGGRIATVAERPPVAARRTVDVSGLYVTPGLIDIHVHAYGGYEGWMFPDPVCLPYGVTTAVDTGGSGWKDFEDFRATILERSRTRILAFLNIVGAGMTGAPEQDPAEMDPAPCAEVIRRHPQLLVGSKSAHFGGPGWESAGGAIEAARQSGTVAMVDFAPQPTRSYQELLERMAPGDIHTHVYAAHIPLLDGAKQVAGYARQARQRGVIFDTGHGGGSFWFRIAAPALVQGFPPDTISTDLHQASRVWADAVMPVTMSKFLALGMPLFEVVYRSTQRPAEVIRRPELGHLGVGAEADVAVFALREGDFGFVDSGGARLRARRKLECLMTVRAGRIAWDQYGLSRPDWDQAGDYARVE